MSSDIPYSGGFCLTAAEAGVRTTYRRETYEVLVHKSTLHS